MSQRTTALALSLLLVPAAGATAVAKKGDGDRSSKTPRPSEYVLPGDRVFPEGIAKRQGSKQFFVGSTTDGTIFRGDVRDPQTKVFSAPGLEGRTTAIGMKVDKRDNLVVAGGATGKVFVLDAAGRRDQQELDTAPAGPTFLNDVALGKGRTAYVTDSMRPTLFKVSLPKDGPATIAPFLDFTSTPAAYGPGFNLNGIVAAKGGKVLVVVKSNTGELFRIDTATKAVEEIDLGGQTATNGDGLLLRGRTLYVVRNQQELVVPVTLSKDLRSGVVGTSATSPALKFPTTAAFDGNRLLLVNAQFDKRASQPELPFSVVALPVGDAKSGKGDGPRKGDRGDD